MEVKHGSCNAHNFLKINVRINLLLYFIVATMCVMSIKTSSSTLIQANNNNRRIVDNSVGDDNTAAVLALFADKKENFVSGTEVERRMFSGLVYNSPNKKTEKSDGENNHNNLRFQSLSIQQTQQARLDAIHTMKVGICACKFEDTITETKI